jgi:hypothetical protein
MARRVAGGVAGEPSVGAIQVAPTAVVTAATDQNITLSPSGTASVVITNNTILNAQSDLRFADADSSNWVAFQGASTISSNVTWTLPSADGTSSQAIVTNGSGTLSFASVGTTITDNNSDSSTNYIAFTTTTSGGLSAARVATTTRALTYQPSTGTLSTTIFTETSSIALKENLRPIDNALDKILQLTGFIYDRKDGSTKNEAGLIAEDVNKIIPNVVGKDENGNPSHIAYQRLTAYLIEAVKIISNDINQLKNK